MIIQMRHLRSTPSYNMEADNKNHSDVEAGSTYCSKILPFLPIQGHRRWGLIDVFGRSGMPRRASSTIIRATLRVSWERGCQLGTRADGTGCRQI